MSSLAPAAVTARRGPVRLRQGLTPAEWARLVAMATTIVVLFAVGFGLLLAAASHHYRYSRTEIFGVGTGILALTLGIRHAFDADHISAIDNTTRKLMADGKRPLSVGFSFSLGHSTVVFLLAIALNLGIRTLDDQVANNGSVLHSVTGIVGTTVSGTFLYLIALLNIVVFLSIFKVFGQLRSGRFDELELEKQLDQRGLMNRFFGPLARRVDTPWKMFGVGLLFGLGFDTATEVALLVLSGTAVSNGLPFWAVLSLPILFAAGMCLFDTLDGCFMNFAYGWSFSHPMRKVYYNLVITGLSVAVALLIGTIELLGLLSSQLDLQGWFWHAVATFNINTAGFVVVGLFAVTWVVALSVWHLGKLESRLTGEFAEDRAPQGPS